MQLVCRRFLSATVEDFNQLHATIYAGEIDCQWPIMQRVCTTLLMQRVCTTLHPRYETLTASDQLCSVCVRHYLCSVSAQHLPQGMRSRLQWPIYAACVHDTTYAACLHNTSPKI